MGSLLKASLSILFLGLIAGALALAFGSMEKGQGEPAAFAPTPVPSAGPPGPIMVTVTWPAGLPSPTGTRIPFLTNLIITPSDTIVPRPIPSVIIDPTWAPPPPLPTYTPTPTPTRLPATGGPYISESKAIEITVRSCGTENVNHDIPPKAILTTCKAVPALIGKRSAGAPCEREFWVVFVEGRFKVPGGPMGFDRDKFLYTQCLATMDATTGEISTWGLRNDLDASGGPYISEQQAIEAALPLARAPGNQVSETTPPKAILTAAKNINSIIGDPRPGGDSEREKRVVIFEGKFRDVKDPPPPAGFRYETPDLFAKLYVVIDAKGGLWNSIHVSDQIEKGRLVRE